MTAQDLTLGELKICVGLYSGINSVLFTTEFIISMDNETWATFDVSLEMWETNIFRSVWYGRTAYVWPQYKIQPLIDKKLLLTREEDNQKFYILNKRKEFKEFFKELEIQIALGSIHYNPE